MKRVIDRMVRFFNPPLPLTLILANIRLSKGGHWRLMRFSLIGGFCLFFWGCSIIFPRVEVKEEYNNGSCTNVVLDVQQNLPLAIDEAIKQACGVDRVTEFSIIGTDSTEKVIHKEAVETEIQEPDGLLVDKLTNYLTACGATEIGHLLQVDYQITTHVTSRWVRPAQGPSVEHTRHISRGSLNLNVSLDPQALSISNLSITQRATPSSPVAGNPLRYTISVQNRGPINTGQLRFLTDLRFQPKGEITDITSLGGDSSPECQVRAQFASPVECLLGVIAPGATKEVQLAYVPNREGTLFNSVRFLEALIPGGGGACPIAGGDLPSMLETTVTAGGGPVFGTNLLANPQFSAPVEVGGLPTVPGYWRGDQSGVVGAENSISPNSNPSMLKFIATGLVPSVNTATSQQWQLLDLRPYALEIATGRVRADARVWFNRLIGNAGTDTRFELRVLAFPGGEPTYPARAYPNNGWIASTTAAVNTTGNLWEAASTELVLPTQTSFLLYEIYAVENVSNDGADEFSGHYADDASLILNLLPE